MRYIKLFFLCCFFTNKYNSRAQEDFKPLQCSGKIPKEFIVLSSVKTAEQIAKEKKEYKSDHSENKKKEKFIQSSTFLLDEILLSGRVLFNDPLTDYINKILENILGSDTVPSTKVSLYILRSDEVNAFATNSGIIFMTTGLLAEVENEAQLAYILGHELTHYKRRHVINSYLESDRIFSSKTRYTSYDDKIKSASSYSRELELEADYEGILLISETEYDIKEALYSMDVLQFSELPYDEIKFDPSFLGSQYLNFPGHLILDSITPIDFAKDELDDTKSSHPNIKKRREAISNQITGMPSQAAPKKFIQEEEKFYEIQRIARFETIRYLLSERRYTEALYEAYVLNKQHPQSPYLEKSVAKALYGIAKYKFAKRYFRIADHYNKKEGEIQRCFYFFEELSLEACAYIACRNLYLTSKKYNDPFLWRLSDDLFEDLINKYSLSLEKITVTSKNFLTPPVAVEKDTLEKDSVSIRSETVGGSKYDKLRKQKENPLLVDKENTENFYQGAFCDLIDDEEFKNYFRNIEESAGKTANEELSYSEKYKLQRKAEKERKKKGLSLGVKKIVLVDPFYLVMDRRQELKIQSTEQKLINFSNDLKEISSEVGLETDMLAPKLFTPDDVELYNNMSTMNFWISERLEHDDMDIIPLESEYAESVSVKHNSKYFLYSGIVSFTEKREKIAASILMIALLYTAPIGVYNLVKPNQYTYYYSLLFDVTTGSLVMSDMLEFNLKDNRQFLRSQMYDQMLQIKREKKP